ncbi:MAG TPA: toll/interleukin-1 receptor domain-containing protein [Longimicrobium sp.]
MKIGDDEATKFQRESITFDDLNPGSFERMLRSHRTFLTILADEIRLHPGDFLEDPTPEPSWAVKQGRVLRTIAKYEEEGHDPNLSEIESVTGLTTRETGVIVRALLDGDLITGMDASSFDGFDVLNIRLLPAGRKVIGQLSEPIPAKDPAAMPEIRLFISHSSHDRQTADALIRLLRDALSLPPAQIRCTSVDGYRLPAGVNAKERLRTEIFEAEAFIGLISHESLSSTFVLFELGARWGAQRHLIPLLVRDFSPAGLSGPLSDLNALQLSEEAQIHQLITDLGEVLNIVPASPAVYTRSVSALAELGRAAPA